MRKLTQVVSAQPSRDGDGVMINHLAGYELPQRLNPFWMIDEVNLGVEAAF